MKREIRPGALGPAESAVMAAVDESWLLATLSGLVAIPSWEGRERPAQEYMAAVMDELGMDLDVWEIDEAELSRHPGYCTEIARQDPLGVVGRVDPGGRRSGHRQAPHARPERPCRCCAAR